MSQPLYFLHIPKTAGVSFTHFLESHFDADEICKASLFPELFEIPREQLGRYKLFRGHLCYGLESYVNSRLSCLTMLREPVARIRSFFQHVRRDSSHPLHHRIVAENWTFEDFITSPESSWEINNAELIHLVADFDYEKLASDHHGYGKATVLAYLGRGNDPELLALAKQRLESMAFFGLSERLEDSMLLACHELGLNQHVEIRHLNAASNKNACLDLSSEGLAKLHELTRLDQELYRFAQQLFDQRYRAAFKSLIQWQFESDELGKYRKRFIMDRPIEEQDRQKFSLEIRSAPATVQTGQDFEVKVVITNHSGAIASSRPTLPVHVSYHWLEPAGETPILFEGRRSSLGLSLRPGRSGLYAATVLAPETPGRAILRLTLVQENVAWFDQGDNPVYIDAEIEVQE